MAEIKLEHITKRFGDVVAVDDVNLEIHDQEFVVFVGPSGCGKTTTLRAIAGLEAPDEGDIFIDGNRVNTLSPADRDIAFVFQFYALYPHLTVYDNIAFPLKAVKAPKSEIQERVKIQAMLDRKPSHLSGGEMQRVALGRAMVRRPKAFLMDEPMSNLDAKLRVDMRTELKRLQHRLGATTIFVTHDQVEAMSMADRIVIMHQGSLQQIGTPQEVYNQPQTVFVAQFMGSPSMNLINGKVQAQTALNPNVIGGGEPALHLNHTDVWIELSAEQISRIGQSDEIIFGVRPEHIVISKEPMEQGCKASVHLVEALGSVNIIDIFLGENPETGDLVLLKARTHPAFKPDVGQSVWFDFDAKQVRLFEPSDRTSHCLKIA
ncbi:Oligosaccharides import ATP-binding protein MsmX [Geodia barretti]|uniref:Oligosaccharides import ATP-binding protein MsmX n=1 Tax=Geodia barretti TaxID=519541 RepID=A0AA35X1N3_GEOBA|nr:Oligosaccharides import ATP-binding protein MsmX [Geodia barretti]